MPKLAALPVPRASHTGSDARAVCHRAAGRAPAWARHSAHLAGRARPAPAPLPSCCGVCRCCPCPPPLQRAPHPEQHPVLCPQLHWGLLLLSPRGAVSRMSVPGTPVPRLFYAVSALGGVQNGGLCRWPRWVFWWPHWLSICWYSYV